MEWHQSTRDPPDSITSRKMHRLVRLTRWWHHRTLFLQKWGRSSRYCQWRSLPHHNQWFPVWKLDDIDPDVMWFQQDGATCHTAIATIDLLKSKFGDKLISRNGPVNWPARSCDLTPLDYFLWGYVKSLVYADKPATIEALEANIVRVLHDIRPAVLEKVAKNWTSRMRFVKNSRGGHMPELIFKC